MAASKNTKRYAICFSFDALTPNLRLYTLAVLRVFLPSVSGLPLLLCGRKHFVGISSYIVRSILLLCFLRYLALLFDNDIFYTPCFFILLAVYAKSHK